MCAYYAVGQVGKALMLRVTPMCLNISMGVYRGAVGRNLTGLVILKTPFDRVSPTVHTQGLEGRNGVSGRFCPTAIQSQRNTEAYTNYKLFGLLAQAYY